MSRTKFCKNTCFAGLLWNHRSVFQVFYIWRINGELLSKTPEMTSADLSTVTGQAFWTKALDRQRRCYSQAAHRQKESWDACPHYPKLHANVPIPPRRLASMCDPMFATKIHDEMYRSHASPDSLRSNPTINNSTSQVQQALFGFR